MGRCKGQRRGGRVSADVRDGGGGEGRGRKVKVRLFRYGWKERGRKVNIIFRMEGEGKL